MKKFISSIINKNSKGKLQEEIMSKYVLIINKTSFRKYNFIIHVYPAALYVSSWTVSCGYFQKIKN